GRDRGATARLRLDRCRVERSAWRRRLRGGCSDARGRRGEASDGARDHRRVRRGRRMAGLSRRNPNHFSARVGGILRGPRKMSESIALLDATKIEQIKSHAKIIAASGLVPDHFAKNPQAIYTAIDMARALKEEPVTFMQNVYFIGGRAGMYAQYMLSRLRRSGAIRGTVRYRVEGKGDSLAVTCSAVDAETGEEIFGPTVSMSMANAEGWTKNPKYRSMPEVMLRKRAVTFLVREHYPDVLMGFSTVEELEDMAHGSRTVRATVVEDDAIADLNAKILGDGEPESQVVEAAEAEVAR